MTKVLGEQRPRIASVGIVLANELLQLNVPYEFLLF